MVVIHSDDVSFRGENVVGIVQVDRVLFVE
jgi:hypothetical protein